jgi:WD40 repeat protein
MSSVAAHVGEEQTTLSPLIAEARRRARRRRQRYAVGLVVAAGAAAGAYLALPGGAGVPGGSGASAASPRDPVALRARRLSTWKGSLTIIGGEGMSAIGRGGSLRTIFECGDEEDPGPCYLLEAGAWSPDGRRLAFGVSSLAHASAYNGLHVVDPRTGSDRLLSWAPGVGNYDIAWSPRGFDGYKLAYVSGQKIFIVHADSPGFTQLRTGTAGDGLFCGGCKRLRGDSSPSWSSDGTRIAYATRAGATSAVYIIGIDGSHRRLLVRNASAPAWSPDGETIAYRARCGVKLVTPEGRDVTPQSASGGRCLGLPGDPVWSPDGKRIAFGYSSFARRGIYVMRADGTHLRRVATEHGRGGMGNGRPFWRPRPPLA